MIGIPTINQLYIGILADLQTQYGSTISPLGKNMLRAFAGVQAGKLKLMYLLLGAIQGNMFADTAAPESKGGTLERIGRIKLQRNPFPAVAAQYKIQLNGSPGAIIGTPEAPATFKSDDTSLNPGMLFVLDSPYTMTGSSDQITLRALTAGTVSKLNINDTLTATAPIANVNSSVYVVTEMVQPLAAEDVETTYRAAVLNAERLTPQGGTADDYRLWSQDASGISKVYPYAKSGATNEINLFIEAIFVDSTDGKGTPGAGLISSVQSVVEQNPVTLKGRRPLQVIVNYLPVTPQTVDIIVASFTGITLAQQTLIFNALKDLIFGIRPFVAASDILANKNDILDSNKIVATILSTIPGASFGAITLKVNSVIYTNYTFINGNIPSLNTVTYV